MDSTRTSPRPGKESCPIPGCLMPKAREHALCREHWFKVSAATRAEVWEEYRRGRGSPSHMAAYRRALEEATR